MINHRGFHFGCFGKWDPRCDTVFVEMDEINRFSNDAGIEPELFLNLVTSHEIGHRWYYSFPLVMSLASTSWGLGEAVMAGTKESALSVILTHNNYLFDELDPMLDAIYCVAMVDAIPRQAEYASLLAQGIAGSIADSQTRRLFDSLLTVYKALGRKYPAVNVLAYMSMGPPTTLTNARARENAWLSPNGIFSECVEIIATLAETNRLKSSGIPEIFTVLADSAQPFDPNLDKLFGKLLSYGGPELSKLYESYLLNLNKTEIDTELATGFANTVLGLELKDVYSFERRDRKPGLAVFHYPPDHLYDFRFREDLQKTGTVPHLCRAMAFAHAQDCVSAGFKAECIFCEMGVCAEIPKPFPEKTHRSILTISDLFQNASPKQ